LKIETHRTKRLKNAAILYNLTILFLTIKILFCMKRVFFLAASLLVSSMTYAQVAVGAKLGASGTSLKSFQFSGTGSGVYFKLPIMSKITLIPEIGYSSQVGKNTDSIATTALRGKFYNASIAGLYEVTNLGLFKINAGPQFKYQYQPKVDAVAANSRMQTNLLVNFEFGKGNNGIDINVASGLNSTSGNVFDIPKTVDMTLLNKLSLNEVSIGLFHRF
jgi:hypothetical protein